MKGRASTGSGLMGLRGLCPKRLTVLEGLVLSRRARIDSQIQSNSSVLWNNQPNLSRDLQSIQKSEKGQTFLTNLNQTPEILQEGTSRSMKIRNHLKQLMPSITI